MPRNSRIEQVTQAFAVQISVPIFVRFLEELGDISAELLRAGTSQNSHTNSSSGLSSSSSSSLSSSASSSSSSSSSFSSSDNDQSSLESSEDEMENTDTDEENDENQQALLQIMQWVCTNRYWTIREPIFRPFSILDNRLNEKYHQPDLFRKAARMSPESFDVYGNGMSLPDWAGIRYGTVDFITRKLSSSY